MVMRCRAAIASLYLFILLLKSYPVQIELLDVCCVVCLQEANCKTHKASKVLILGNMKMLLTTGTSRWNDREMALWDQVRGSRTASLTGFFWAFVHIYFTFLINKRSWTRCQKVLSCVDSYNHLLTSNWSVKLAGHVRTEHWWRSWDHSEKSLILQHFVTHNVALRTNLWLMSLNFLTKCFVGEARNKDLHSLAFCAIKNIVNSDR